MQCKAIIVDDEQPICDEIEYLLKSEPGIEIVATFNNASEALGYIQGGGCDLVFLDIKMPGLSGLEMAQKLSSCVVRPSLFSSPLIRNMRWKRLKHRQLVISPNL